MPVLRKQQYAFTRGVLDPGLAGRQDFEGYYEGMAQGTNVVGLPQGGVTRREGLAYLADIPDAANGVRFLEHSFSDDQAYLLVFTDELIRVFFQGAWQADVTAPWLGGELGDITWAQADDTMLLFHPDRRTQRLMRSGGHDRWTLDDAPFASIPDREFGRTFPKWTVTPSAVSGTVTLTASAEVWRAGDVGAFIEGNGGECTITAHTSATQVTATTSTAFADTSAIPAGAWLLDTGTASTKAEPVWSDRRGWPVSGTFHQGRLIVGGARTSRASVWASKAGQYFDFGSTAEQLDDESWEIRLHGEKRTSIHHVVSDVHLLAFGSSGVHAIMTGTAKGVLTPTDVSGKFQTGAPSSARATPLAVEEGVMFVRASGAGAKASVMEVLYSDASQRWEAQDITLLAPHLIRAPIEMARRLGNESTAFNHLYLLNGDGTLAVLNTLRKQKVTGWTLLQTEGTATALAVAGNTVYLCVTRTIAGLTAHCLEKLDAGHFLDCSKVVTADTPTTTFGGFDHLAGQVVRVRADGAVHADVTVDETGTITTTHPVSAVEAGFGVAWTVATMPLAAQLADGTVVGRKKRVTRVWIDVQNTAEVRVNGRRAPLRRLGAGLLDQEMPTYTGIVEERILGWGLDASVTLSGADPLPATIRGVTLEVVV